MTEHHHVHTEFTCTAPVGAQCRMHCKTCYDEQLEACQCSIWGGGSRMPNMQDFGSCLAITWLSNDAPEECYEGTREPVRGPEPQPITVLWNSDNCGWEYA